MTPYRVRLATAADAEAICRIYNQGIEDRVATLETELRTPEERRQWLQARSPRHPVIVADLTEPHRAHSTPPTDEAGLAEPVTVVAWGSLNVFNPREAYRFVADLSVYVERAYRGKGVGDAILGRLIELARERGFHKMVLSAFPDNAGGMALYAKHGFRTVGVYREQGLLDGRWVDTIVMEKIL
ncbi:MAG: N-acetyltransferase [Candidatus Rokubacteria bacterium]|nr:N-acetyltransferase [Candidatus Rokubacteria bacterium]